MRVLVVVLRQQKFLCVIFVIEKCFFHNIILSLSLSFFLQKWAFLMGFHERVGAQSSVVLSLSHSGSTLFDENLIGVTHF